TKLSTPVVGDNDVNLSSLRLNGLYSFNEGSRVRPFVTGGVGVEQFKAPGLEKQSDFGFNGGAGFRIFITPNWAFRADGRFVQTKPDALAETERNITASPGNSALFGG